MAPHQLQEEPLQQKRNQSPTATSAWSPLVTQRLQVRNQTNTLPVLLKGLSEAGSPHSTGTAAEAEAALLSSSPLTREEAEHVSREEGKQSSQTYLLFSPSSLAPAPAAPTSQRAVHWPQPPGHVCPRGCRANVVFPPSPTSVAAAPLHACCGIWLPCSHGAVGHRSRLIPHRCRWPGAFG